MPGLLPEIDPDGLLEYSVVYTDRALNHMSQAVPGRDDATSPASSRRSTTHVRRSLVPGSGTFGMEAVARQFATGQQRAGDPQRLVQLPLDADLRDGQHPGQQPRC